MISILQLFNSSILFWKWSYMHILPLKVIFVLWLTLNGWITNANDAFCRQILWVTE